MSTPPRISRNRQDNTNISPSGLPLMKDNGPVVTSSADPFYSPGHVTNNVNISGGAFSPYKSLNNLTSPSSNLDTTGTNGTSGIISTVLHNPVTNSLVLPPTLTRQDTSSLLTASFSSNSTGSTDGMGLSVGKVDAGYPFSSSSSSSVDNSNLVRVDGQGVTYAYTVTSENRNNEAVLTNTCFTPVNPSTDALSPSTLALLPSQTIISSFFPPMDKNTPADSTVIGQAYAALFYWHEMFRNAVVGYFESKNKLNNGTSVEHEAIKELVTEMGLGAYIDEKGNIPDHLLSAVIAAAPILPPGGTQLVIKVPVTQVLGTKSPSKQQGSGSGSSGSADGQSLSGHKRRYGDAFNSDAIPLGGTPGMVASASTALGTNTTTITATTATTATATSGGGARKQLKKDESSTPLLSVCIDTNTLYAAAGGSPPQQDAVSRSKIAMQPEHNNNIVVMP